MEPVFCGMGNSPSVYGLMDQNKCNRVNKWAASPK